MILKCSRIKSINRMYLLLIMFSCVLLCVNQIYGSNLSNQNKFKSQTVIRNCNAKDSWTLIPNLEDCHKFYLCINGIAEELTCAINYYYDTKEKRCKIGQCQTENSATKCNSEIVRRIDDNCNAFSLCENGEYVEQNCTAGHYFSTKYASCQPISPNPDHLCSCLLPPYAAISNPDNCETYYSCTEERKAVLQKCPGGQYFNERVNSCLPDLNGICRKSPTITPSEFAMIKVCSQFGKNVAVFKPADECDKFVSCINGQVFSKRCPKGYYYDPITHFCQWDTSGECANQSSEIFKDHLWGNTSEKREIFNGTEQIIKKKINKGKRPQRKGKEMNNVNADESNVLKKAHENLESHKWNLVGQVVETVSRNPQKNSLYNKLSSKFINF